MIYSLVIRKDFVVYFNSNQFHLRSSEYPLLNPVADVTNRILAIMSEEEVDDPSEGRPNNKTNTIVDSIFRLYITGRISEVAEAFSGYSYYDSSASLEFHFPEPELRSVKSEYMQVDARAVVQALDRTLLLTAYLYERIGLAEAATRYYSAYYSALKRFVPPGMDNADFYVSRRASLARLKLHDILPSSKSLSKTYREHSYLDELIEHYLEKALVSEELTYYLRSGTIGRKPGAPYRSGLEIPAEQRDRPKDMEHALLHAEYCLYQLNNDSDLRIPT